MNLWFRLLWLMITSRFRPRLEIPRDVSRLKGRVWPNDLDLNRHVNNGRYWTLFDLGRIDLIARAGLIEKITKYGWAPLLSSGAFRYRRELKLFQRFILETQVVYWEDTKVVIEHRIMTTDGKLATKARVLGGFYDRKNRRFVQANELLHLSGQSGLPSAPPDSITKDLLSMNSALKDEEGN